MKKSQKVTIALVSTVVAAGIGVAAWDTERNEPKCIDQQTGERVDDDYCEHAYHNGHTGYYGVIYRNQDGTTSTVDAGNKSAVAARGGFGSDGGYNGSAGG